MLLGSRNTTAEFIASVFLIVSDVGRYDFSAEFSMDATRADRSASPETTVPAGTPFLEAASEQLGVKLVPSRAVVKVPVVDAVEKPSEN